MSDDPTLHVCDTCRDQPGSNTALTKGCTCPVMDNGRGHNEHRRITREGCPMHWPTEGVS